MIFNLVIQNKKFTFLCRFRQMIDRHCFIGMIRLLIIISSLSLLCFGNWVSTPKATFGHILTQLEADSSNWCSLWGT